MLSRLESCFREGVVRLIRRSDDDELHVRICQHVVKRTMYLDCYTESIMHFSVSRARVSLENRMQRKEIRKRQDEGYVEGETSKTDSQYAGVDRFRHCSGLGQISIGSGRKLSA